MAIFIDGKRLKKEILKLKPVDIGQLNEKVKEFGHCFWYWQEIRGSLMNLVWKEWQTCFMRHRKF